MTWICANCGERHEEKNPPCKKCTHEQFAKLQERDRPKEIESTVDVEWECKECGTHHVNNNPPCKNCNHMQFKPIQRTANQTESGGGKSTSESFEPRTKTRITGVKIVVYLIAIATVYIGFRYTIGGAIAFGLPLIISGFLTLPYIRKGFEKQFNFQLSIGAVVIQYCLGWIAAISFANIF